MLARWEEPLPAIIAQMPTRLVRFVAALCTSPFSVLPNQLRIPPRMQFSDFEASLSAPAPPPGLAPLVQALWWDAHGDWDRAHSVAQEIETTDGAWVHAYLHRREGDTANARYWYRRAAQSPSHAPLEDERTAIVTALLAEGQ